jgi:hypothetical protein
MALSPQDRTAFVNAFTRVLINAWSSDEFAARLDSDPKAALLEGGLEIPADAQVVVVRQFPDTQAEGDLDVQIALWERGLETKVYELHIPMTPQVDTAELTEGDLDSIAAGLTIYACCCPCSCS